MDPVTNSFSNNDCEGDILRKLLLCSTGTGNTMDDSNSACTSHYGEESTEAPQEKHSEKVEGFKIDINCIETVPEEQQAKELLELGISVYDQETLEKGIINQVDRALEKEKIDNIKRQYDLQIKSVQEDIQAAEELLQSYETSLQNLPIKETVSDVNEALLLRRNIDRGLNQIEALKCKENTLVNKRNHVDKNTVLEDDFSYRNTPENDLSDDTLGIENAENDKETEQQKMIRLGQMTPFGTILPGNTNIKQLTTGTLSDFNKYLQSQADFQRQKCRNSSKIQIKTQDSNVALSKPGPSGMNFGKRIVDKTSQKKPGKKYNPLKPKILHPKKKKKKMEKLGTDTEFLDCNVTPGALPSETRTVNLASSGSEYVPSDYEGSSSGQDKPVRRVNVRKVNVRKKSKSRTAPDDEWHTDDSDWEYSDDEKVARKRKRGKKVIDDGNMEDYFERLRLWEKEKKAALKETQKLEGVEGCNQADDEEDFSFQELDGGLKIPSKIWDKLFSYQKVGVQWMWELHQKKCGGILGDEMGLGKTIQVVALFAGLASSPHKSSLTGWSKGLGPSLIVCPATMLHQWVKEFHEWFPPIRIAIMHESGSFSGKGGKAALVKSIRASSGVLVTSYEGLSRLADDLSLLDWHIIVLDEGHVIRNPDARITLAAKRLRTPHRLLLSGSPLQNNLRELWSLFDFIFPGKLGTLPVFTAEFAIPITQGGYATASQVQVVTGYKCATVLKDTIAPYLLRRMKADVKDHINLPSKNEQVLFCRLTDEQRDVYREYLKSGDVDRILTGTLKVFVGLINLRKICNHPHLYTGGPKLFKGDEEENIAEHDRYGYWNKSGKMIVVENLLRIWNRQGHRVLLFTQGKQMMCILERFVIDQGYTYLKLDGTTSISSRQPLINEFNKNASYFIFLLTTRVGGLGVNLTGANRVLIYDPDWNPATDTQARERAWRPGQIRHVTVYRLVTAGTIEEKIYHRQIFKQFLTDRVLRDPRRRRFFKSNDLYELFTLHEDGDDLGGRGAKTETSAIFAGTGSEIKIPSVKRRKIDEKYQGSSANVMTEMPRKVEKAKKSFQEMAKSKNDKTSTIKNGEDATPHEAAVLREAPNKVDAKDDGGIKHPAIKFSPEKIEMMKRLAQNLSVKVAIKAGNIPVGDGKGQMTEAKLQAGDSAADKFMSNILPSDASKVIVKKSMPKKSKVQSGVVIPSTSLEERRESHHYSKKKKSKHKSRRKDCVFEGEKVAHLVGVGESSSKSENNVDEAELNQSQDDYVLKKLFAKSGLTTALRHDVIMDGGDADYAIVEGEAERVAHEAVKALKESRRNCWAATSGVPTWTGQNGMICQNASSGGRPKPLRFGKKKVQCSTGVGPVNVTSEPSSGGPLSSQDLLLHIRNKDSLLDYFRWKKRVRDGDQSGSYQGDADYNATTTGVSRDQADLLDDIRGFVACGAATDGQATTSEILARFNDRLPPCATPQLFKSMLKSICDLHNQGTTGSGLWKLKPEFCD